MNNLQPWRPTELLLSNEEIQLSRDIAREDRIETLLSMLEIVLMVDIIIMQMVISND